MTIRHIMMLLLLLGVASSFLTAQDVSRRFLKKDRLPTKAWVYLNNGELINAIILKDNGQELSIKAKKKKTRTIPYKEIEKISGGKHKVSPTSKGKYHYDEGFFLNSFFSLNIAGDASTGTWQSILGYKFSKKWAAGIGGSFDGYADSFGDVADEDFLFGSLFGYARYNLNHNRARFFLYSRLGYSIGLDGNFSREDYSDGYNFHPGIGVTLASNNVLRWIVELGMAFQKVNGQFVIRDQLSNQDITSDYENLLIRPLLKIGVEFH